MEVFQCSNFLNGKKQNKTSTITTLKALIAKILPRNSLTDF